MDWWQHWRCNRRNGSRRQPRARIVEVKSKRSAFGVVVQTTFNKLSSFF